jgi:uncharacterized membrane protein YbaN (DUF454 family)
MAPTSRELGRAGQDPRVLQRSVRWMQAGLGVACFGLGAVGTVVPGMPTTIFVLVGSYFLARSCPALERKLREARVFRPYAIYLEPSTPFPPRARRGALAAMWVSIAVSGGLLAWRGVGPVGLAVLVLAGLAGTWAILQFRRHLETRSPDSRQG